MLNTSAVSDSESQQYGDGGMFQGRGDALVHSPSDQSSVATTEEEQTHVPRILLVDDDAQLLQALPEMLRIRMGDVVVDTAESGAMALDRIVEADYDAIISDIKMPGLDGIALLARVFAIRPSIPTLLITGHGEHDLALQALRGGAYDYIQKPIDRDYLVATLNRAIQLRQLRRQVEDQRRALERYASSLEQMVEERTRDLLEANRVKDEFLSVASHELRNPLVTLKLHMYVTGLELERAGVPFPHHWEPMNRAVDRIEMLVNDLVDTVRMASGKLALRLETCDLRILGAQAASEQEASTGRTIILNLPPAPLEVEVDGERMEQVLSNLLVNAIKYSPPDRPIRLQEELVDGEVILSVSDQGVGIPREHLSHIFERFYQVPGMVVDKSSPVGLGLGLGLYICREIVERHGGRIWVESMVDQGSTFYVALHPAPQMARQSQSVEHPSTTSKSSSARR